MAGVMAWTQEASSLSSVTEIASNPPPRPDAPTASRQALVLYIARVPGSRDVFLTPIKPREKVVTAEDVQSSLYFVHIACEDESCSSNWCDVLLWRRRLRMQQNSVGAGRRFRASRPHDSSARGGTNMP